jgi:glycosyltransferase involved in cell wall biosynthesis
LIASLQWGVSSEVWIRRQIAGFKRIRPEVVCWERRGAEAPANEGVPVHLMNFEPQPMEQRSRWLLRLRNAAHGNFYGSVGGELRALRQLLRTTGAQVILCHFGHMALRLLPAATACGVPLVAHFHGLDVSSGLRNRWYRTSLLRHLSRFAAIVVVGSHQRQWMIEHGVPPERVHLIPCGVPTAFFSPAPRPARASGPLRIAAVSRLVPWKGIAETIRAVAEARSQGIAAELRVVGDGDQRAELEALVGQLLLNDHVTFLGPRDPAFVRELLNESDVFVQHSLTSATGWCEGFGVSIAEAAAMELPVIATRSGGIPDQVLDGETGILIAERDVAGMAAALVSLARSPDLRARLGRAGRQRMVAHFDVDQQVARLEAVMLAAVDHSPPRNWGSSRNSSG